MPATLEVHLILENSGTRKTPLISWDWLVRHLHYHLHFTPTGTSWIHLAERWVATLTNKQLRRGIHRSTREREAAIAERRHERPPPAVRVDQDRRRDCGQRRAIFSSNR